MIEAKNCSLIYKDGTEALKPFNLSVKKGEIVYITGPSGSGKTSLLKLILGMVHASTGEMIVLDTPIAASNALSIQKMRRHMGPIFQDFRLLEGRTVFENVVLGMRFLEIGSKLMKERANEAIEKVGLSHKLNHRVEKLSFGESQRVAIARAVARRPQLIVADEPTGNLDQSNAENILDLLTSFKNDSTSIVLTTHATHLIDKNANGLFVHMSSGFMTTERR